MAGQSLDQPATSPHSYKMSRSRGRCKEADEQYKHFFKVMIGDFRDKMIIPEGFAKHLGWKLERKTKLESCNGCIFDVEITNNLDKPVLQSGWNAFVIAHDLKLGDFLLFEYNGISRLKVIIFDPSGCEKEPSCLVMENATHELLENSSSYHDIPINSPQSESYMEDKIVNISSSSSPSEAPGCVSSSEDDLEVHSSPKFILPRRTLLTNVQIKKLNERVQAINSEIPVYGCIMRMSNIHGKPCTVGEPSASEIDAHSQNEICRKYADVYLPYEDETLVLQRHGKSWNVRCRFNHSYGSRRLLKGWGQFARGNNLQVGDICLFELMKNKKYLMNVHVIHKN